MWLLPTYNRPDKCAAVLDQINSVGCSTPGMVIVNGYEGISQYARMKLPPNWQIIFSPVNLGLCGAMQLHFLNYSSEPFYGLICDDEYVFTPGWDKTLINAAGRFGIAHGNDGWQSETRLHTYATFGGDLIRTVGWWALPNLWHWFFDDIWELIAKDFELKRYCRDVKTEHKHYKSGKAEKDQTYFAAETRSIEDRGRYKTWLTSEYPRTKARLEAAMGRKALSA
jgi:hypothetical protein